MKTKLEFTWESGEEFEAFSEIKEINDRKKGKIALTEIAQEIFRPARKHGYDDPRLSVDEWSEETHAVVEVLEEKFREILEYHKIELE